MKTKTTMKTKIHKPELLNNGMSSGILMANNEPIDIVASLAEAQCLAVHHFSHLDPNEDACPDRYALFFRGAQGRFELAATFEI